MATSGDVSWQLTRDQIIKSAYRKLGYLAIDQTLGTTEITNGAEALNSVIALMVTKGMPLWKRLSISFVPSATSQVYIIPGAEKLAQVVLIQTNGSQYDLIEKSLYSFNNLPQITSGVPVHYTYQPTIPNGGTLSIWPLTSDSRTIGSATIKAVYQKQFDGVDSSGDTLDFPSYWTYGIVLKLALMLAPETGFALPDRQFLQTEFQMALADCMGYGDEDGSLFMQPDFMGRREM